MKRIIAAAALVLLAACGGSPAATGSGAAPSANSQAIAYSQCMRSHGVPDFPDPTSNGIPKETAQQLGVSGSQYQAATQACGHLLPNGGGGPTQAEVQQEWTGMLDFARCMRAHGVPDWPDPIPYPQDPSRPTYILPASMRPTSQIVSTMYECQRLVPHNAVGGHIDNDSWQSVSLAMAAGS